MGVVARRDGETGSAYEISDGCRVLLSTFVGLLERLIGEGLVAASAARRLA